jgi:hypothetical protein
VVIARIVADCRATGIKKVEGQGHLSDKVLVREGRLGGGAVATEFAGGRRLFPEPAEGSLRQVRRKIEAFFSTSCAEEGQETAKKEMVGDPSLAHLLPPHFGEVAGQRLLGPLTLKEEFRQLLVAVAVHAFLPGGSLVSLEPGEPRLLVTTAWGQSRSVPGSEKKNPCERRYRRDRGRITSY